MNFLRNHMPQCTPLDPCVCCKATTLLKSKLSEDEFREFAGFVDRMRTSTAIPYNQANPAPDDALIDEVLKDLSTRIHLCLDNENIRTIGDLTKRKPSEMLRMSNFGRKSLKELTEALASVGRHFAPRL